MVYYIDPSFNLDDYFVKQAGSGISGGYEGDVYHKGNGIPWGKILSTLKPAWEYIKKFGWSGAQTLGSELIKGTNLADAAETAIVSTSQGILDDANNKLQEYKKKRKAMRGGGVKKKTTKTRKAPMKRKSVKKSSKKSSKTKKKVYKKAKTKSSNYI